MHNPFYIFGGQSRVSLPLPLSNLNQLLAYLEMSPDELNKIRWFRGRMYRKFDISKGKSKKRTINSPNYRLKMLQKKISIQLAKIYKPRNSVHGFVSHRSVKTNAQSHIKQKYILNIDIKDFFPSITESRVRGLLEAIGLDENVSAAITWICCNDGCLPQGAPSSPLISNMICFRLDKNLQAFAKRTRCIYTRYADDITFSSHQPLSLLFAESVPRAGHFPVIQLSEGLRNLFTSNGFTLNDNKAHYADKHSRRTVTGIRVNEVLNIDRKFIRNVRAALYKIETIGLKDAQKELMSRFSSNASIEDYLRGKIAWLGHIKGVSDPIFRGLAARFNRSFAKSAIKIQPTQAEMRDRAVWVIEHFDGEMCQGSAFFLESVGLVTAAHCVEGSTEIELYHPSKPSNKFSGKIKSICSHRDLAIIEHNIPSVEYFELRRSLKDAQIGEELIAAGYPGFGPGDKLNIRPGTVSSRPVKSAVNYIEVTQKLAQGMSGGPLLDTDNNVSGVIHKGGALENRDFAVHIGELYLWLGI
ncbi:MULTISPECIES: reverse transcriptase domain-containing protein [Brucella/Ochrobactrum group]|nr:MULTISPECIES: reverse transcriptase domain-containing protein [Brucella/Ochrobactrum group]